MVKGAVMNEKYTPELFLSISETWNAILRSGNDIEEIRNDLINHVNMKHFTTYSGKSDQIHELELIIIRDCARSWRGILHARSEKLAGFSVLSALVGAASGTPDPNLSEAFWAEICHLVRGVEGMFRINESVQFSFSEMEELTGREAAQQRSSELDVIHDYASGWMSRYPSGLDPEQVKARDANMRRILPVADNSRKWEDWHWQLRNIARDEKKLGSYTSLSDTEIENIKKVNSTGIPFGVTPYYASLFDVTGSVDDRAVRAQVIFPQSYIESYESGGNEDYMLERDTSPEDLITRRYPDIVILKPYNSCPQICVYCQRNWEIKSPLEKGALASERRINAAIEWIGAHKAITEVLVTGGDPLVMADSLLEKIIGKLSRIEHVKRIRLGTRIPVTVPMRITEELCDMLASFRDPGRREIAVITHIQNPLEVTPELVRAVERIKRRGISVYNQLVFTFFISRRFEAAHLRSLIKLCGVDPYYSFYPKGKLETADYRVPIARMLQERKEESRLMPGLSRTDEPVYNVPGLGKNYLNAWQHRDLISIKEDGSRVYEFHPWEKQIAERKTYVGEDVPILDYLRRLEEWGESASDYESIWYYF